LLYDDPRYYQAIALSDVTLLALSADNYLFIYEDLPGLEERLEVAIQSRSLAIQVDLPWLQKDEYVHVMTRRHPAILWSRLILPVLAGISSVLFSMLVQLQWMPDRAYGWFLLALGFFGSVGWLFWRVVDWRNDYFIVTNKRVVWIEKVALIYESRQEAPLRTIMSVGMERSRVGSLMGFADVVVMTYVGTIRLRELAHAEVIASMIESYWHRSEFVGRKEESQAMAEKLGHKLGLHWGNEDTHLSRMQVPDQDAVRPAEEPGFLGWLFSDFIRLRYELDGAIIYRKHWFVLVEKSWLPVLLMLLTLAALVGRLGGMLGFLPMTSTIIILLIFLLVCFVWITYQYADWRNDIFKVTLDQIIDIDRKPLGKIRRRSAPLENVLSIEYERLGFWGFLFNFGTVYISVGNLRLSFDHVYNPSEVQQDIFYRMGERLDAVRQFEIDSERDRMSEWIASYHRRSKTLRQAGGYSSEDDEKNDRSPFNDTE